MPSVNKTTEVANVFLCKFPSLERESGEVYLQTLTILGYLSYMTYIGF
jgi:hypothetical protein